ncbi:MAG: LexA family transcriptional regulator [Burkholderiaceae bacterium]|nr:LexA family transcriptional regulator [Burkholderiaceae bacterium]
MKSSDLSPQPPSYYVPVRRGPCYRPLMAGHAPAGFPSPAADHYDKRLDLNEHLVLHPEATFFLRVKGDSMIGAGIHDGDLLVVDRSLEPSHGRVVIAALDGELTVKRLHQQRGKILLCADNPNYPAIEIRQGQELQIWGVVAHVIHKV